MFLIMQLIFFLFILGFVKNEKFYEKFQENSEKETIPDQLLSSTALFNTPLTVFPTTEPTLTPSIPPTTSQSSAHTEPASSQLSFAPTNFEPKSPTLQPTFNVVNNFANHSFACLSSCPNFPGQGPIWGSNDDACTFLQGVFGHCTSFSVAFDYCPIPLCAANCTVGDWCFLAASTVGSCVDFGWPDAQTPPHILGTVAELDSQCRQHAHLHLLMDSDDDDGVQGDKHLSLAMSDPTKLLFIVFALFLTFLGIICVVQNHLCRKPNEELSDDIEVISFHANPVHADSSQPQSLSAERVRVFDVEMSPLRIPATPDTPQSRPGQERQKQGRSPTSFLDRGAQMIRTRLMSPSSRMRTSYNMIRTTSVDSEGFAGQDLDCPSTDPERQNWGRSDSLLFTITDDQEQGSDEEMCEAVRGLTVTHSTNSDASSSSLMLTPTNSQRGLSPASGVKGNDEAVQELLKP